MRDKLLKLVIIFFIFNSPSAFTTEVKSSILIIHSYNQGAPWTDHIMEGMMDILLSYDNEIDIHIEYLDAQRTNKKLWPNFENYLKTKYYDKKFDIILASDDDILEFLIPRYKDLFPTTPIIFCGINNINEDLFKEHPTFIGINQDIDTKGTIELALKLKPKTKKFLVISDQTSGGLSNTEKFKEDMLEFGILAPEYQLMDDFTLPELKKALQNIGKNDLILVLRLQKIKGIEDRRPVEFQKIVTDNSHNPVFKVWGTGKTDFIGGVYVSSHEQGRKSAEIALRILNGENLANLPQIIESPNIPTINYTILNKYKISEKAIPENAIVMNKPDTFFVKYRYQILIAIVLFLTLVLVIISLLIIIKQKINNEKSIQENKQAYKHLFEYAPIGLMLLDEKGHCIDANKNLCNLIGYSQEQIIGMYISEIISSINVDPYECNLNESVINCSLDKSYPLIRNDGTNFYAEAMFSPTPNGNILCAIQDITKRLENIKKKEQQDKIMRQTQKMQAIGQLAGGIAHDFNNMLTGIMGCSELIATKTATDSELKHLANLIMDTSMRAAELTKKLLTYSHKGDPVFKVFNLHEVILNTCSMLERSIDKSIVITTELHAEDSRINADLSSIENSLINLGINARDAMPKGGQLTFFTRNVSSKELSKFHGLDQTSTSYIEIDVQDTGSGMTKEVQERIFEPFFTTKPIGNGTGLGLSLVYSTVKENKGFIDIYSELDYGSSFKIFLPVITGTHSLKKEIKQEYFLGDKTILIADDENIVRIVITKMLTELGYNVLTSSDGEECINIYKEKGSEIDLVIIDMIMPKVNGKDVFNELRSINKDVKAVLCSGFAQDISIQTLIENGLAGFIQKPFSKLNLSIRINEILAES